MQHLPSWLWAPARRGSERPFERPRRVLLRRDGRRPEERVRTGIRGYSQLRRWRPVAAPDAGRPGRRGRRCVRRVLSTRSRLSCGCPSRSRWTWIRGSIRHPPRDVAELKRSPGFGAWTRGMVSLTPNCSRHHSIDDPRGECERSAIELLGELRDRRQPLYEQLVVDWALDQGGRVATSLTCSFVVLAKLEREQAADPGQVARQLDVSVDLDLPRFGGRPSVGVPARSSPGRAVTVRAPGGRGRGNVRLGSDSSACQGLKIELGGSPCG